MDSSEREDAGAQAVAPVACGAGAGAGAGECGTASDTPQAGSGSAATRGGDGVDGADGGDRTGTDADATSGADEAASGSGNAPADDGGEGANGGDDDAALARFGGAGAGVIREELAAVQRRWRRECLTMLSSELCVVTIASTPYRKLVLKAMYPDGYPDEPLLLELTSNTLDKALLAKLTELAQARAKACVGEGQLVAVMTELQDVVASNCLLYAWPEVKRIKSELKKKAQIKVSDGSGRLKFTVKAREYKFAFELLVPDSYPADGPEVNVLSTNFHYSVVNMAIAQAEHLARKCSMGFSAEQVLTGTNIEDLTGAGAGGKRQIKLTAAVVHDLKHDVRFLQQQADMKKFAQQTQKGNAKAHLHSAKERKKVRRALRKMNQKEAEADMKKEEEAEEKAAAEARAATSEASDIPQRSLFAIANRLVNYFGYGLTEEPCQGCHKTVFPESVAKATKYMESEDHKRRPMYITCGHWFHYQCLDTFLTRPPFGKPCPACLADGREIRVVHSRWPSDIRRLEKAWALQQARKREFAEIADFMGC